jgi:hypothetical protein
MKDVREGEKSQLKKGLELLKELKNSIFEDSSKLEKLKSEIVSLEVKENNRSHYYNSGLSSGKANLIRYLEKIQKNESQNELAVEQKVLKLETKLEEFVKGEPDYE